MHPRFEVKTLALFALLLSAVLISFSVRAGNEDSVEVAMSTEIERGSIDVNGNAVSFLGNVGSSPLTAETGAHNVLLLHGAKFSAQTWQDLGTLSLLAGAGYRVAAVDLPTQTKSPPRDELLELMCDALGMSEGNPAVIVSPSMSGSFSVPLLFRKPSMFAGYVPVAPGTAGEHSSQEFAGVTGVPALIVYGERDSMGTRVSKLLSAIPGSHLMMIQGASHPAYLDEPDLFHERLLEFLKDDVFHEQRRKTV